jgi:hypothetical protein
MKIIFEKMDNGLWNNSKFINKLANSCKKTLVYENIYIESEIYKKSKESKVYVQKEIFELFLEQSEKIKNNKNFINKFREKTTRVNSH